MGQFWSLGCGVQVSGFRGWQDHGVADAVPPPHSSTYSPLHARCPASLSVGISVWGLEDHGEVLEPEVWGLRG